MVVQDFGVFAASANGKLSIAFNRIKILFIPLFYLIKMPQIKNTSQFVALIH